MTNISWCWCIFLLSENLIFIFDQSELNFKIIMRHKDIASLKRNVCPYQHWIVLTPASPHHFIVYQNRYPIPTTSICAVAVLTIRQLYIMPLIALTMMIINTTSPNFIIRYVSHLGFSHRHWQVFKFYNRQTKVCRTLQSTLRLLMAQ